MKSYLSIGSRVSNIRNLFLLAVLLLIMQVPVSGSGLPELLSGSAGGETISFTVSMDDAVNHNFRVTMTLTGIQQDLIVLKMPVWTPGYYWIQNYPKNLSSFTARDEKGKIMSYEKTLKNAWKIPTKGVKELSITYTVYADNHSVADPFIDSTHAFIAPAGLFLYPEGKLKSPSEITFIPYGGWQTVSTGLDPVPGKVNTYTAPDFDVLFDSPVLIGNQEVMTFDVNSVPHHLAVLHPGTYDREKLMADYKKMVQSAVGLIGEMPYRHYTFLIMGQGGGGLEHTNSMAVFTGFRGADIYPAERKSFLGWMSFIAHEFYHLYNVKTIRPVALGPFDYDRENYTNMLWVSEGFTVYFEDIILNRAGFMNGDEMLESYSRTITNYESVPGSRVQPVTLSSFDTWINFFNRSKNSANTTISYYDKGCGLALLLDLKIRHETDNKRSLNDVMRRLYCNYYKELGRGFTDSEFRSECESIAGCSLEEIFNYASSTVRPDYNKYLDYAGLYMAEESSGKPEGSKFILKRSETVNQQQKKIYDDMFRPVN